MKGFFNDQNINEEKCIENDLKVFIDGFSTTTIYELQKKLEEYNPDLNISTKMINNNEAMILVATNHQVYQYYKKLMNSF
jgi:hypothetical protein